MTSLVAYGSDSDDSDVEKSSDVTATFKANARTSHLQSAPDVTEPSDAPVEVASGDDDNGENTDHEGDSDGSRGDVPSPASSGDESDQADWPFKIKPRQAARLMPSPPRGKCSNSLQRKIEELLIKKQRNGLNLNRSVQRRKDFRNPSIYEKLVSFVKIDELGSNFTTFNPAGWGPESYYEKLAIVQKEQYDKKQKEAAHKTQVEFVKGTKRPPASTSASAVDEPKKKRSKWDSGPPA